MRILHNYYVKSNIGFFLKAINLIVYFIDMRIYVEYDIYLINFIDDYVASQHIR